MIPTFRPWTHTSDDSYMYQLSLVVATATVSYKEKCILCVQTTILLPVCRRERAADRSFNGTFLGLCILALHICPPSPPFKEVRVPNQSTKDRRAKTEAPHFTPFFTSPRFSLPPREPQFFVYCRITPSCVTPVGSTS